jgi:hypothetical protein
MRDLALKFLSDFFRNKDWKKRGLTWSKEINGATVVCEYQGARIFHGFYLNFGVLFKELAPDIKDYKSDQWHFNARYDAVLRGIKEVPHYISFENPDPELLPQLQEVALNTDEIIIPVLYKIADLTYLKENFPNNFDHQRFWLQNIREIDLVNYIRSKIN